jgi:sensor histidine kinase regulating citrate/malate metabolism
LVILNLTDNAHGFPPEKGSSLMEKGNTSKKSGSGFGLYNCKQIIESHKY